MLLRYNRQSRIIFNSLLVLDDVDLRGTTPSPPSAITALRRDQIRCVNLKTAWENPSDLSAPETWRYFLELKKSYQMQIDLIILDMECQSDSISNQIEECLATYVFQILSVSGTLIYKTYLKRLLEGESPLLTTVGSQFQTVHVTSTDITSSQSSEVYVVMRRMRAVNLPIKPNLQIFLDDIMQFPVLRSPELEFKRAMSLTNHNMYSGVPEELITDPVDDLVVMAETLGVEPGVTAVLEETIKQGRKYSMPELPFLFFLVCVNSILRITSVYKDSPKPPSDSRVYNLGVLIVGFLQWLSVSVEDYCLHMNAQNFLCEHFTLSWATSKITNLKQEEGYLRTFKVQRRLKSSKSFHLDSHMAKIGQMIRCLYRVFERIPRYPNKPHLNAMLKVFNKTLTLGLYDKRFNLTDLLTSDLEFEPTQIVSQWEHTDPEDVGWNM